MKQRLKQLARRVAEFGDRVLSEDLHIAGAAIKVPVTTRVNDAGMTETWMVEVLRRALPTLPGVFVDVGVNLGQTLVKVKALEPTRRYVGFEPNPVCSAFVQELVRLNGFTDCTLLPIGLYTEDTVLSLALFADNPTDSSASLIENFRSAPSVQRRTFVPVFRYDRIAPLLDLPLIGIVKIDVEGAELEVVQSLEKLLTRDRPVFLLEVLPSYSVESHSRVERQQALERVFKSANYVIYRIQKTPRDDFAGLTKLASFGIHGDLALCDYLVVPDEMSKAGAGILSCQL